MTWADWIVVSVTLHYLAAGAVYWLQGQPLMTGLYGFYAGANVFLILLAQAVHPK